MSAFDKVIGYDAIKNELMQITDMIRNKEVYANLGAKLPQGVLIYGKPGLGKTLMAKSFIEESGLEAYTVRRNKGSDDFVETITETFAKAKRNAPSIVFLDDLDKFANEDCDHRDAEEYVAVQAGIDDVKGCEVFVLATANEWYKLPSSLVRSGRFDRKIEVRHPTEKDTKQIIKHYLSSKKVSENVNMEDLACMISYSSCAELESILNEAAIYAAYARKDSIEMEELVQAVLRMQYQAPDDCTTTPDDELQKIAMHEAGHLVVCEALCEGSVGLASLRTIGEASVGGFIHRCKELQRRPYYILVSLAGKAAVELFHSETVASGCHSDLEKAYSLIREGIGANGTHGFGMLDMTTGDFPNVSESFNERSEAVTYAEMERYMIKVKNILLQNRDFLEKVQGALLKKETLLYSDIRKIRESVKVTEAVV